MRKRLFGYAWFVCFIHSMLHFSVSNTSAKLGKYPHWVIYHKVQQACPTRLIKCCWMKIWFRQAFLNSSRPFLKCNYTLIFLIKGNNLHKWITKNCTIILILNRTFDHLYFLALTSYVLFQTNHHHIDYLHWLLGAVPGTGLNRGRQGFSFQTEVKPLKVRWGNCRSRSVIEKASPALRGHRTESGWPQRGKILLE